MKKFFIALFLLILPMAIFAQDVPASPTGWEDVIMNPGKWVASFGAISVLTAFIAAFINGLLKFDKGFKKQLIAWGVAIILLVATDLLNFGYAADFAIWLAVLHGFGAGLASNGASNIPIIKAMLEAIENLINPKK